MVRYLEPRLAIAPLIVGFLALAAIVITTFWLNERSQFIFQEVVAARMVRGEAVDLRSALQSAESSQRGYLYTHNEIYLAPYDVAKTQARKQIQLMQGALSTYPELQAARDRLADVVEQKLGEIDQTIALQQERREADAMAMVQTNRGKALMDEANVYVSGIIRAADERLVGRVDEQKKNAAQLRFVSIIGALIIVAMAAIIAILCEIIHAG